MLDIALVYRRNVIDGGGVVVDDKVGIRDVEAPRDAGARVVVVIVVVVAVVEVGALLAWLGWVRVG